MDIDVDNLDYNRELGQRIANKVGSVFNRISFKAGKPIIRSNGLKEWTVLASIVLITDDDIIPICIATGVKVLPDKVREYSKGTMVHDLHAEILVIRAFNRFIINECKQPESQYIEKHGTKFKLKPHIKIGLLVTEPPCGDASMSSVVENSNDSRPWSSLDVISDDDILRGRSHFHKLGVVRTKPGRLDSIATLSKSCSDKLCLKQLIGLNNCITSSFMDTIYLDYLVVKSDQINMTDIRRCFYERFEISLHPIEVLIYHHDDFPFHKVPQAVPCLNSLVYISSHVHIINNGVKLGSHLKNKAPLRGGESILCNKRMFVDSLDLIEGRFETYQQFKKSQLQRQQLKQRGKEFLKNWICTSVDDFSIINV